MHYVQNNLFYHFLTTVIVAIERYGCGHCFSILYKMWLKYINIVEKLCKFWYDIYQYYALGKVRLFWLKQR